MQKWREFLESFATNGAAVLLLFVLTQVTFALTFLGMPKAEDVMYLSCGALLGLLKGETGKRPE
jgi:hypothetical protein